MRILLLLLIMLFGFGSHGYSVNVPLEESDRLEGVFLSGNFAEDTNTALNAVIATGVEELRHKHFDNEASRIESEWKNTYQGFILNRVTAVGDHAPIQWLFNTWATLNALLGKDLMHLTHLDDIWEFAYTIPVVFWCEDHIASNEYSLHFVMFSGAVSYWVSMSVCAGALFGSPFALICSPVGDVCEYLMVHTIAPKISPKVWGKVCQQ
jgi:hypothetical protein